MCNARKQGNVNSGGKRITPNADVVRFIHRSTQFLSCNMHWLHINSSLNAGSMHLALFFEKSAPYLYADCFCSEPFFMFSLSS